MRLWRWNAKKRRMKNGYLLLLCNPWGATMEVSYLEKFSGQRVDAIIQIGGKVDELVSDTSYMENINKWQTRRRF